MSRPCKGSYDKYWPYHPDRSCKFTATKRIDGTVVSTHCTWCWLRKP